MFTTQALPVARSAVDQANSDGALSSEALLHATLWLMGFGHRVEAVSSSFLCAFIRHHGIAGLLQPERVASLGKGHAISLTSEHKQIVLRGLMLGAALKLLVTALTARGLKPLALKGPALALQAHGNLGARGGVDLDILLSEDQWPTALEVLQEYGYGVASGQQFPLPKATHELSLVHRQQPRVELHRRLLRHQHLLSAKACIAQTIDLQGTTISCLTPTYAVPYLIAHANQHCFRRLIWLIDIYALLQRADLDMDEVAVQIRRTGTCAMLDTCLTLLSALFGLQAAAPLQEVRRPCWASRAMAALAMDAIRESLSDDQVAMRQGFFRRVTMDISLQDTFHAKWQALLGWLSPTAKDSDWVRLPQKLTFLYPFIRLSRLAMRRRGNR